MEAFDKAIEDTITAINTGCLRSRDGTILAQAKGKDSYAKKIGVIEWTQCWFLRAILPGNDIARKMKLISCFWTSRWIKLLQYLTIHSCQMDG